jgi:hypothetical protein
MAFSFGTPIVMIRFVIGVGLPLGGAARARATEEHLQENRESDV